MYWILVPESWFSLIFRAQQLQALEMKPAGVVACPSYRRSYADAPVSGGAVCPYYRVVEAGNGQEGMTLIRELHPNLVLTDIMMPI